MSNIIDFKQRPKPEPEKKVIDQSGREVAPSYQANVGLGNRLEMWSPPFFGVQFLIWGSGRPDGPPELPPPTGGTPAAANAPRERQQIYAVAA